MTRHAKRLWWSSRRLWLVVAVAGVAAILGAVVGGREDPAPGLPGAPKALPAEAFVDSVGVDVHVTYYDTAYARFDEWASRLRDLGVRHVRDGLIVGDPRFVERMRRLQQQGARASLITSDQQGPAATSVALAAGPLRGVTEALEGPNEPDLSGGSGWQPALRRFVPELRRAVKGRLGDAVPLLGPSFVQQGARRGFDDLADQWDVDNIHPYPGGEQPLPPSSEQGLTARKPVMATEDGYHDAVDATEGQPGVPQDVAAAYLPRLLAENFRSGVKRTYLYEFLDEKPDPAGTDPEQHFGLLRQDLSPKPGYRALRNLLRLVSKSPGDGSGRKARARLRDPELQQLLLKRRDGSSVLLLWRRESLWDTSAKRRTEGQPVRVPISFAGKATDIVVGYPAREAIVSKRPDGESTSLLLGGDLVTVSYR